MFLNFLNQGLHIYISTNCTVVNMTLINLNDLSMQNASKIRVMNASVKFIRSKRLVMRKTSS